MNRFAQPLPWEMPRVAGVAAIGLFAAWAAALVLVVFNGSRLYSVPMVLATLAPFVVYASSNTRLCLLWGLVFTAVFGLSINFGLRVHMGGAPSYAVDLMDFFLVPLAFFLLRDHSRGLRRGFVLSPISLWWLGAILLGLLTVLLGPFRTYAGFEVARMLKCWVLFLVLANECVRERHFEQVVMALAAAVLLNVLVAFAQFALKRSLGLQALGEASADAVAGANLGVYLEARGVYRVSALVGHPNVFSAYLAMLLPLFTAFVFAARSSAVRLFLVATVLTGILALVLTLSRAGWADYAVAMACVMAFLFLHPVLRHRWVALKWTLAGAIALIALVLSGPIVLRWTASDPGALDFRYEWLGVAWKMIQTKPLLGFGLNSFSYQLQAFTPYSTAKMIELFGYTWPVVHNIYFLVWAEQGLVGLLLFLGLNAHLVWMAWRNIGDAASPRIMMMNLGLLAGVMALLVDGLASFYMRIPGPARIFWILAALIVASHHWNLRTTALRSAATASNSTTRSE